VGGARPQPTNPQTPIPNPQSPLYLLIFCYQKKILKKYIIKIKSILNNKSRKCL